MKPTRLQMVITFFAFALGMSGCGPNFTSLFPRQEVSTEGALDTDESSGITQPSIGGKVTPFCSPLSFKNVSWDPDLTSWARRSLSISLSLTGSFEGHEGWKNLTNNFDGMGMSAGLLNQTLGTGSLQPLIAQLRRNSPHVLKSIFPAAHYSSLMNMITSWETATNFKSMALQGDSREMSLAMDITSSPLDFDYVEPDHGFHGLGTSATAASVAWAKGNLYTSSGAFTSTWRSEFQKMLVTPEYVSLQIKAALRIHDKAMAYVTRAKIDDLRTYLLMFDIVTQNGGINESEFQRWEAKVKSAGLKTVASKLKALIDIRVLRTRAEYRNDVRSRKYAIIDGAGTVHGSLRKLTTQYCYQSTDPID